ncbi:hypothetical protein GIB67_037467 [Kingdonia uniflora]|nr:hypothetical protein GIB67_037467 [Kingdonia uniflora]
MYIVWLTRNELIFDQKCTQPAEVLKRVKLYMLPQARDQQSPFVVFSQACPNQSSFGIDFTISTYACLHSVISVALEGEEKDKLVVVGENVDSAR